MRGHYPHRRSCSAAAAQLAGGSKHPCFFIADAEFTRAKVGWVSPDAGKKLIKARGEIRKKYRPKLAALKQRVTEEKKAAGHIESPLPVPPKRG